MDGFDDLSVLAVPSGDPAADAADKFIIKTVSRGGNFLYGDHIVSVIAHQNHRVVDLYIRHIGNVYHHLVHTHPAQDWCPASADQHIEFTGKTSAVAVGIPTRHGSDPGFPGGDKGAAVTDFPARRQHFDMGNAAAPLQGRL